MLNSIFVVHATQHALNDMDRTQINVVSATTLLNMFMQAITHDSLLDVLKASIGIILTCNAIHDKMVDKSEMSIQIMITDSNVMIYIKFYRLVNALIVTMLLVIKLMILEYV